MSSPTRDLRPLRTLSTIHRAHFGRSPDASISRPALENVRPTWLTSAVAADPRAWVATAPTIPDAALGAAIARAFGKASGGAVAAGRLERLVSPKARNGGVRSGKGLRCLETAEPSRASDLGKIRTGPSALRDGNVASRFSISLRPRREGSEGAAVRDAGRPSATLASPAAILLSASVRRRRTLGFPALRILCAYLRCGRSGFIEQPVRRCVAIGFATGIEPRPVEG